MTRHLLERNPDLPWVELCSLPTPVREAPGLGCWVKDDTSTAALKGGNKPRKLEWLLGDARAKGRRGVVTFGGTATNHGLATALFAREQGLECTLALVDQPEDDHVRAQRARIEASGAHIYLTRTPARTRAAFPWIWLRRGRPYFIPTGGSSPVGALGFVEAALELGAQVRAGQLPEPAAVISALGSGGSAAGLAAGLPLAGLENTRVVAVLVNDLVDLRVEKLRALAGRSLSLLGEDPSRLAPIEVVEGFLGEGYGHGTPEAAEAMERGAAETGLGFEPVYTGKALAALLAGAAGESPVLYWHTNGPSSA